MTTQVSNGNGAGTTAPAPTFTEAPASATVDAISPSGRRWLLTTRAATVGELMQRVEYLDNWLSDHGWTAGKGAASAPTTQGNGEAAPTCPAHNVPMKQGRRGWYCPVKLLEDGGDGRPVYCKQTVK